MRPLPKRLPSRSASWSMHFALFTPVLGILSVLAHRSSSVDTRTFLVLLSVTAFLGLFTLLLTFLAFRSLWLYGKKGGRRATWALILTVIVLSPYVYATTLWFSSPVQADVSTDLINPPVFRVERAEYGARADQIIAGQLRDGYPAITGRRYDAPAEVVLDEVLKTASGFGWRIADRTGRSGADDDLLVEFLHKTTVLAFPIAIVIRITDEGDTSFLDVRSQMPGLEHDLGVDAQIISGFLSEVDLALVGQISN